MTADHGEELWDHGGTLHGHTLYDELVCVPFIIRWPGHLDGGKSISGQVSNMCIMTTLLDAIGVQVPTQCQAPSVLEFLQGKPLPAQRVFSETDYQGLDLTSVRTLTQKIVINKEKGDRRVFDLAQGGWGWRRTWEWSRSRAPSRSMAGPRATPAVSVAVRTGLVDL